MKAQVERLLPLVAGALAFVVYANSIDNPFVYDDLVTVIANPALRDPRNVLGLLLQDRFRPLINVGYAIDYALWGLEPRGFHLTSILLHALNAALVVALGRRLAEDARLESPSSFGFLAGATFAVHPLLTESVGYISGRAEVQCATLALTSLLLFRRHFQRPRPVALALAVLAFLAALACKETAAILPFVLLAYDRFLLRGEAQARRRLWRLHLPLIVLVLVLGSARLYLFFALEREAAPRAPWQNLLAQSEVIWRYFWLLVAPYQQSLVHAVKVPFRPTDRHSLLFVALLVVVALALGRARRRSPLLALSGLWFLLFLLPSSSVIPLLELMSEHRVYLASVGFFLALALLVHRFAPRPRRAAIAAVVITLVLSYGALTWLRNEVWADPLGLWEDAKAKSPGVWISNYALGDAYRTAGLCDLAIPEFLAAIDLVPSEPRAYVSLAECLLAQGKPQLARQALRIALTHNPDAVQVYNNLGYLAYHRGDFGRARRLYDAVLRIDPGNVVARRGLATIHELVLGDASSALELCRWLVRHDPSDVPARACVRRLEDRLHTEHAPLPAQ